MQVLYFTVAGVLQSWGEQSSWNVRDSADWPTKSGIVGMISAAMGLEYNDPRIGELCESIEIGMKTRQAYLPQLDDFQTVNYLGGPLANGTRETRPAQRTIVQHKYYVMDRKYLIALTGAEDILGSIYKAMMDPCWAMHLGRACCPPSEPLIPQMGEYDSLEAALCQIKLYDNQTEIIQVDGETGQIRTDIRASEYGKHYKERYVMTKVVG